MDANEKKAMNPIDVMSDEENSDDETEEIFNMKKFLDIMGKDEADEETDDLMEVPNIEDVDPSSNKHSNHSEKGHHKAINFTNEQSLIKQACLFPSFSLIQQFADDLHLHEK